MRYSSMSPSSSSAVESFGAPTRTPRSVFAFSAVIASRRSPSTWTRPPPGKARRRTCLADVPVRIGAAAEERGLDPQAAVRLNVQRRRDRAQLAEGDRVWVAPAGRTLRGHRRASPYAIIRAGDRQVFWATGMPMPGQNW